MIRHQFSDMEAARHLEPAVWAKVNALLVEKIIRELTHERLLEPARVQAGDDFDQYTFRSDQGDIEYRFRAREMGLDHLQLDRSSLRKLSPRGDEPLDAMALILELKERLGIPKARLPHYLEELASTLYGAAFKHGREGLSAAALTRASFQEVETSMMEGHPIFIANNGRLGFDAADYRAYAPEAASPTLLVWLAAKRERTEFACVDDLSYDTLIADELGPEILERFARKLAERGCSLSDYLLLPVHPWQFQNRIAQLFAPDLARGDLVYLGESEDQYLPQQSLRTFFNVSKPHKRYVKTALSILNMGFRRGLSPMITKRSAAVNDWVSRVVHGDSYLGAHNFRVLREVAFVGYRHRYYEKASTKRCDVYKDMLAALWRESPTKLVREGQRLMTMASLMHVDTHGASLLAALIESSGLSVAAWLEQYLRVYLKPLLHCFYAHNLTFSPHCENVILVLKDNVPVGVMLKDLAEDIGVLNPERELPEGVKHLALRVPEEVMTLVIFTDVFDCVFRFLAPLLCTHMHYPEASFWRLVAACIREYEREQPDFAPKHRRYDLFAPTFVRNCLNRLQLTNNEEMVDLNAEDPVDSLQFVGTLKNPIARFQTTNDLASSERQAHGIA